MNEAERREKAVDLVNTAYEGGAVNIERVVDELSSMGKQDRADVIKKMELIDRACHENKEESSRLKLPTLDIISYDSKSGSQISVETRRPKK
ncbi:MAG: hypothetical protein IPM23_01670 [Candidatus Melainabacteria bacterium]|nr:hypothetical protein [Candidatus Melainabacteria bacterium]